MHDFFHRAALATLLMVGLATALSPLSLPPAAVAGAGSLQSALLQGQLLVALVGLGLVLALVMPNLRAAALGAAILSKAGFLAITGPQAEAAGVGFWLEAAQLLLLLAAAAVLAGEARQQARWEGVLPLRQEG